MFIKEPEKEPNFLEGWSYPNPVAAIEVLRSRRGDVVNRESSEQTILGTIRENQYC